MGQVRNGVQGNGNTLGSMAGVAQTTHSQQTGKPHSGQTRATRCGTPAMAPAPPNRASRSISA
eukprot:9248726-Lingulodinium_polyedra.AAC.1